ncbi:MAG: DNA internalization-related competence protein ComEC/Rec2 [Gemmatimonadota bacterium]
MNRLPPLARAMPVFAGGILLGFRAPVPFRGGLFIILGLALAAFLVLLGARRHPWLAWLVAGIAAGGGATASAMRGCVARLPDDASLRVRGAFAAEAAGDAARPFLLEALRTGDRMRRCSETVRVRARRARAIEAGVEVVAVGRWLETPASGAWPRRPERMGVLVLDSVRPLAVRGHHVLLRARGALQRRLRTLFPREAALAEALLLARREGLDPEVRDRFARAGLSHVLAISGLHVAVLAGLVLLVGVMVGASRNRAAVAAAVLTAAYMGLLGAPYSAVRATIQISLLLAARILQRPSRPLGLLAAAALIILVADPVALLDVGFQLSFAALIGIITLGPRLQAALARIRPASIRGAVAVCVAASAATTPLAAYHFGRIAPIGIAASLVAVPLVGLAVPAVLISLLTSLAAVPVGDFLASGAEVLLGALRVVATVAAGLPFGHGYVTRATALFLAALVLFAMAGRATLGTGARRRLAALVLTTFVLWPAVAPWLDDGALEIHMVDVGQGDAVAIRSPAHRWILVDAGPRDEHYDAGERRVVPYLLRHDAGRLSLLVLTHADADHIGGAGAVLHALKVDAVMDPGLAAGKPLYLSTLDSAQQDHVRWVPARAGRQLDFDGAVLHVLYPREVLDGTRNQNDVAVVFRLTYGRFSALFMADAPASVEEQLAKRYGADLGAEIIKVGHHGSASSTSRALLDAARPQLALISVGRRNRYGHPAPSVLARLRRWSVRILRTDRDGSIIVRGFENGRWESRTSR